MNISFGNSASNAISNMTGKPRRQSFGIGALIGMLLFGLIFASVGFYVVAEQHRTSGWPRVTGKVISVTQDYGQKGSTTYRPVVGYEVNGQKYSVGSSSGSSVYPTVGSPREVRYNPQQPQDAQVDDGTVSLLMYILPAVGLIIIAGAIFGFIRSRKRSGTISSLKTTGTKVTGVITSMGETAGYTQGGNASRRITVTAADTTGQVREFVSDPVVGNMFGALDYTTNPVPVDVYLDPADPARYYVDLDDIPQLTPAKIAAMLMNKSTTVQPTAPPAAMPPILPPAQQPLTPAAPQPPQPTSSPTQPPVPPQQ